MFTTRKEVDEQVHKMLSRLPPGQERDIKGIGVAKLYIKIQEYPKAIEYLISYLKVNDEALAHKMLAHCYKLQKKPNSNKALQHYQRCIQLNPKQLDVIKDACQLLLDDEDVVFSEEKAKYWRDLAANDNLIDLTVALNYKISQNNVTESNVDDTMEMLIHKEIQAHPQDVTLRVRLLRSYLERRKLEDAFDYAYKSDLDMGSSTPAGEWHNVVWMILIKFEQAKDTKKNWPYWQLALHTLERIIYLGLGGGDGTAGTSPMDCTNFLFKLDQYLHKFSQVIERLSDSDHVPRELLQYCLQHYTGQLLLHIAALLFKRELLGNQNKWKNTLRSALPLLLLGYQSGALRPECASANQQPWMLHCDNAAKKLLRRWRQEAAFRCAQLGRTLYGCVLEDPESTKECKQPAIEAQHLDLWPNSDAALSFIRHICLDRNWRRNVYQVLFTHPEQKLKDKSSLLACYAQLQEPLYEWPHLADIEAYEQEALWLQPQLLPHHVYLSMGSQDLAEAPRVKYYEGMRSDVKQSLSYCAPDSLSKLDVDTFLYAVVLQAQRKLKIQRERYDSFNAGSRSGAAKPQMLPYANVALDLATEEQQNWWLLAHGLHCNVVVAGNRTEQRTQLQYGLEAVRGVNGPRADLYIVFRLGELLAARAHSLHTSNADRSGLEARVCSLFRLGFNMLRRQQTQHLEPFPRLFAYAGSNDSAVQLLVNKAAEEAITYFSSHYFKQTLYEPFIEEVQGLQLPMAMFMQAEAFRLLENSSKTTRVSRSRYQKHRQECLQQTQKLLRNDKEHVINALIEQELLRCNQDSVAAAASTRYSLDHELSYSAEQHNNSSTYEDAEDDFVSIAAHRSRRAAEPLPPVHAVGELEQTVKQINTALCSFKEDVGSGMDGMRQDIKTLSDNFTALSDKFATLEELLKKCRISNSRETPTRDVDTAAAAAAALGLDDLFIIDEALEQQQQQSLVGLPPQTPQMPPMPPHFGPGYFNGVQTPQGTPGDRFFTPTAAAAQPNVFNSPLYNPTQMYNYYQYMRAAPPAAQANLFGQTRNPGYAMNNMFPTAGAPNYMDPSYGMGMPLAAPPPPQSAIMPPAAAPLPAATSALSAHLLGAPFAAPAPVPVAPPAPPTPAAAQPKPQGPPPPPAANNVSSLFNRALNNQPVEKEPPANVVITSSDPLPKPAAVGTNVAAVQPTLSVTIPSQHIKASVLQPSETPSSLVGPLVPTALPSSGFNFNFNGNAGAATTGNLFSIASQVSSLSGSTTTTTSTSSVASFFGAPIVSSGSGNSSGTAAFSFKTQVAEAAAQKEKEQADSKATNDSNCSDLNKSFCVADGSAELDYDPRPDFKGIIPLPDEVEVRTGEEDEEIVFSNRAKLFRFVEKEWKERGIGLLKILKNKATGHSRILMRREQTHKICANHKINMDTILAAPKSNNDDKSFLWAANDFADEELRLEKFLVRFKTPETTKLFKEAFDKSRLESQTLESAAPKAKLNGGAFTLAKSNAVSSFVTSTPAHATAPSGPAAATAAAKPDDKAKGTNEPANAVSKSLFGNAVAKPAAPNATPSPFSNFSFSTAASKTSATSESPFAKFSSSTNIFGTGFSFGGSTTTAATTTTTTTTTSSSTESGQQANKSTVSDAEDEYVPTAQFAPVIPLPELVEVRTGEEHELVLFEHRAKLLRYVMETHEWKERGLGNIKLLQHKDNVNQLRLVMRREQVHKLCLNQRVLKATKFSPAKNTTAALTWAGQDFAEEELTTELLCVRFKTEDICQRFQEALNKAQEAMTDDAGEPEASAPAPAPAPAPTPAPAQPKQAETEVKAEEQPKGFGDTFKPKTGSWSCPSCYTNNNAEQLYCLCCEAPKDATVPPNPSSLEQTNALNLSSSSGKFVFGFAAAGAVATASSEAASKNSFTFGTTPATANDAITTTSTKNSDKSSASSTTTVSGFGDAFKPKPGSWSCSDCYVSNSADDFYCSACDAPMDDSVPKRGLAATTTSSEPSQFKFGFGAAPVTAAFSFGSANSAATPMFGGNLTGSKSEGAAFGSASFNFTAPTASSGTAPVLGSNTFSFSMPKTVQQPKNPLAGAGDANVTNVTTGDDDYQEEEENNAYFAPVIPLPDKIDVKTGEEDEDILYVQRAKLYRLTEGEWKERGVGNVKILRHKQTQNLRVVMRRDKVLKICLNHVLNQDVAYKSKDENSWLFVVYDFSEGENKLERFTLRFKNSEISTAFHYAVKTALNGTAQPIVEEALPVPGPPTPQSMPQGPAISNEIKALSDKLQLSYDFFVTENKCSGCRGCEPEKFDFGPAPATASQPTALPLTLPTLKLPPQEEQKSSSRSLIKPTTLLNVTKNSSGFEGFGSAAVNSTSLPAAATTKSGENVSISFANAVKESNATANENKSANSGNSTSFIFGGNNVAPTWGNSSSALGNAALFSIFGGSNSNGSDDNSTKQIFGSVANTKVDSATVQASSKQVNPIFGDFGSSALNNTGSSLFAGTGSSSSATDSASDDTTRHIFGSVANTQADSASVHPANNNASDSIFGGFASALNKSGQVIEDFASLAAKSTATALTPKSSSTDNSAPKFFGLKHQDTFKNFRQPDQNDNADASNPEDYDPHYDPIIALPDEINVSMGEENETKTFGERATLYRYDTVGKEWKERGVGELKLLHHTDFQTYRMVMRREQVHKLVLNMKIGAGSIFEYMNNSKKSFIWAGHNFAEIGSGELERLACRFQKEETADKFYKLVNSYIEIEKSKPDNGD